jgi:hypothetical protein
VARGRRLDRLISIALILIAIVLIALIWMSLIDSDGAVSRPEAAIKPFDTALASW